MVCFGGDGERFQQLSVDHRRTIPTYRHRISLLNAL